MYPTHGVPPPPPRLHPPPYLAHRPIHGKLMYNAPPILKEKQPRLPWPAVANHTAPMPDPTHGAPPPPAVVPVQGEQRFDQASPPPPRGPAWWITLSTETPPPSLTDGSRTGPGAALPCDPTCLAAPPARAPHTQAVRAPHTHRHGGISLTRGPRRGTGAVISPVGLEIGQP